MPSDEYPEDLDLSDNDLDYLKRLVRHDYRSLRRDRLRQIERYGDEADLRRVNERLAYTKDVYVALGGRADVLESMTVSRNGLTA